MSDHVVDQAAKSGQPPATTAMRPPAPRHEGAVAAGAVAVGAIAIGAMALGALAVGALAIGRLAVGRLSVGRARLRIGQVDELRIARLIISELRVEKVAGPPR